MDEVGAGHAQEVAPRRFDFPFRSVRFAIVDTNVLRQTVLRTVKRPDAPNRLWMGAQAQWLVLLTTPHVHEEMDEHLSEFAAKERVDESAFASVWNDVRARLRIVDVADLLPLLATNPLLAEVAANDSDDVPLAALAILLGVRALSADTDLAGASVGERWLKHAVAISDAGRGDAAILVASTASVGSIAGVYSGGRWVHSTAVRKVGPATANLAVALVIVAALWWLSDGARRRHLLDLSGSSALVRTSRTVVSAGIAVIAQGSEAHEFHQKAGIAADLDLLEARMARHLARAVHPVLVESLALACNASVEAVEAALDSHSAFVPIRQGWQLGHAPRSR